MVSEIVYSKIQSALIPGMLALGLALGRISDIAQQSSPPAIPTILQEPQLFTTAEKTAIMTYWGEPGRVRISLPPLSAKKNPWQVRLTSEGSRWLLKYQIAIGAASAPPTQDPTSISGSNPIVSEWKSWVQAKIGWDRYQAQLAANNANRALGFNAPTVTDSPPIVPGPIPSDLLAACGDPPTFAAAVSPLQTTITFANGDAFNYPDHTLVPSAYAYYRFDQGTDTGGEPLSSMPKEKLEALFTGAGLTSSQTKVVEAVSMLEGGFDAINTYDTGFVSIGFLQFITAANGKGDLIPVLQREKTQDASSFNNDFHRFGIDVTPDGTLDLVDPETGAELNGSAAVMDIIADKRLTAVFQRAGRYSSAFRTAQIRTAIANYWPSDYPITVTINGHTITGKVSDVVHSEAGMATLFDRQVNRGSINPFPSKLQFVMLEHNLTTLAEASQYEQEVIGKCMYRTDFLMAKSLSQPEEPPSLASENP